MRSSATRSLQLLLRTYQNRLQQPAAQLHALASLPGAAQAHICATLAAKRACTHLRGFASSEELRVVHAELSEHDFHEAADNALHHLHDAMEAYVEDNNIPDGDVQYSSGVLTACLGKHGTFVLNKQTPNRQIWLSSPVSGPFRYDLRNGRWVYARDGRDLFKQLEKEFEGLVGTRLSLE